MTTIPNILNKNKQKIVNMLILSIVAFNSVGCSKILDKFSPKVIVMPQKVHYPKFPIEEFEKVESLKIKLSQANYVTEINGTSKSIPKLIFDYDDGFKMIIECKKTKLKYNSLIEEIKGFNREITELNELHNSNSPYTTKLWSD